MPETDQDLIALEKRFWQSMVDRDTDVALGLLAEPALMVSSHGAMQFDHAGYRKMAEDPRHALKAFDLSNTRVLRPSDDVAIVTYEVDQTTTMSDREERVRMSDSSTWVRRDGKWLCAIHTESAMTEAPVKEMRGH
ncbi:nuclear transport factor 2 family protein [Lysobacter sp. 2RAF19]